MSSLLPPIQIQEVIEFRRELRTTNSFSQRMSSTSWMLGLGRFSWGRSFLRCCIGKDWFCGSRNGIHIFYAQLWTANDCRSACINRIPRSWHREYPGRNTYCQLIFPVLTAAKWHEQWRWLHCQAANGKTTGEGQSLLDAAVLKTLGFELLVFESERRMGTFSSEIQAAFCTVSQAWMGQHRNPHEKTTNRRT